MEDHMVEVVVSVNVSGGSVINAIMRQGKHPIPKIGMGATVLGYTDRHAATITKIDNGGKRVFISRDLARRTDKNGMSESQTYEYTTCKNCPSFAYTLRKNGRFVREGSSMHNGETILVGHRESYHDYSF